MNCERVRGLTMLYDVMARNEYANINATGAASSGRMEVVEPRSRCRRVRIASQFARMPGRAAT